MMAECQENSRYVWLTCLPVGAKGQVFTALDGVILATFFGERRAPEFTGS